jgi:hypothetical protein
MAGLFLATLEQDLIQYDFENDSKQWDLNKKNDLIALLARRDGKMYSEITSEYILEHHKNLKIGMFSERCEEDIIKGFVSPTTGKTYRTNRDDQVNMIGKKLAVDSDPSIATVYWRIEETKEQTPHTREEFLAIYQEGFLHKEGILRKLNNLRNDIRACTTHAGIIPLVWDEQDLEPAEPAI